jgi:hypothetical protein
VTIVSRTTLKSYFATGKYPSQTNFEDLIDTLGQVSGDGVLAIPATNGIVARTSGTETTGRSITVSGNGITVSAGNGVAAGPEIHVSAAVVVSGAGLSVSAAPAPEIRLNFAGLTSAVATATDSVVLANHTRQPIQTFAQSITREATAATLVSGLGNEDRIFVAGSAGVRSVKGNDLGGGTALVTGAMLEQNPITASIKVTQAHGLAARPRFVDARLFCVSADAGFASGAVVDIGGTAVLDQGAATMRGWTLQRDATNLILTVGGGDGAGNFVIIANGVSGAVYNVVGANWKLQFVPYL